MVKQPFKLNCSTFPHGRLAMLLGLNVGDPFGPLVLLPHFKAVGSKTERLKAI